MAQAACVSEDPVETGPGALRAAAIVLEAPGRLALRTLDLLAPGPADLVVDVLWSGVSTGTERLLYTGAMPPFPGLAYPLVPGYEAVGTVCWAGPDSDIRAGSVVFVPGARCHVQAAGLFGGSSARLVVAAARAVPLACPVGTRPMPEYALLALAATAFHILTVCGPVLPDLIVGHGALGRLLARLVVAREAAPPPTVWETNPARRTGGVSYPVLAPAADERRDYRMIVDVSGDATVLDRLIAVLRPGGQVTLGGFYSGPLAFAFPPAFQREATIRIAAEWQPGDLATVAGLIDTGHLSLAGLVTHVEHAARAPAAYRTAFEDPACLKMVLDWSESHG